MRYIDPHNEHALCDPKLARAWLPVDMYVGGQEHATLHLLYARFWHKVLHGLGVVPKADEDNLDRDVYSEPFQQLVHQGMILGPDGEKMSKSRGNVISPDIIVAEHGADVLRVYEMFMGPLHATKPWDNDKVVGISRFLNRIFTLVSNFIEAREQRGCSDKMDSKSTTGTDGLMNAAITKVTADIEATAFNTAISALMIYSNGLQKAVREGTQSDFPSVENVEAVREGTQSDFPSVENVEALVMLLSPFAPHIAEECYELLQQHRFRAENRVGEYDSVRSGGLVRGPWPVLDPSVLAGDSLGGSTDSSTRVSVRVNGKFKCNIDVDSSLIDILTDGEGGSGALLRIALSAPAVMDTVVRLGQSKGERVSDPDSAAKLVKRTVFVSKKGILNIVV